MDRSVGRVPTSSCGSGAIVTAVGLASTLIAVLPFFLPSVGTPSALWFLSMLTGVGLAIVIVGLVDERPIASTRTVGKMVPPRSLADDLRGRDDDALGRTAASRRPDLVHPVPSDMTALTTGPRPGPPCPAASTASTPCTCTSCAWPPS